MKEQLSLPTLLGQLKELHTTTAGASFILTYSKGRGIWKLYISNKRKVFQSIVPELAIKEAIDWIKANRREVRNEYGFTLFNRPGR